MGQKSPDVGGGGEVQPSGLTAKNWSLIRLKKEQRIQEPIGTARKDGLGCNPVLASLLLSLKAYATGKFIMYRRTIQVETGCE